MRRFVQRLRRLPEQVLLRIEPVAGKSENLVRQAIAVRPRHRRAAGERRRVPGQTAVGLQDRKLNLLASSFEVFVNTEAPTEELLKLYL